MKTLIKEVYQRYPYLVVGTLILITITTTLTVLAFLLNNRYILIPIPFFIFFNDQFLDLFEWLYYRGKKK